MKRKIVGWILFLLVLAAVGLGIRHILRPKPVKVSLGTATRGMVERTVANTRAGTVKACRRARLAPNMGGQILHLPVARGDKVHQGQLLLELWNADLEAQLRLTEREAASVQARSEAVCLRADVAGRNAERLTELRRYDAAAEERLDNARAEANALAAECRSLQAEVRAQEARQAVARANLERTRLVAPFDGVVAEINGERFEYVTPSPLGIATLPVLDIIDPSCFYVTAPIDEVDAAEIRVGMPARIILDAFGSRNFEGRVRRIADYVLDIEKQARTVDVEADFARPEDLEGLLAGYSADLEIILDVHRDVLRVPTEAVMEGGRVYLFDTHGGKVALRQIQTGLANWDHTEVRAGLASGDRVVLNVDNAELADGKAAVPIEGEP